MRRILIGSLGAGALIASFMIGLASRPGSRPPVVGTTAAVPARGEPLIERVRGGRRARPVGASGARAASPDPVREALASGQTVVEAYDAQRRDEEWARPVETFMQGEYAAMLPALIPSASALEVACKETLCKVAFDVPEAETRAAMWRTQHMTIADGVSPYAEETTRPGVMRVVAYARFAPPGRPVATLSARWRDEMAGRFPGGLDQMRTFLDAEEARLQALAEGQ